MVEMGQREMDNVAIARLESAVTALSQQVTALTEKVDVGNRRFEEVIALQQSHAELGRSVERAFNAISTTRKDLETFKTEIVAKNGGYDRYLWLAVGFITCVSLVWSAVAYRLNSLFDETSDKLARLEIHLAQDKITSSDDVRAVIDGR